MVDVHRFLAMLERRVGRHVAAKFESCRRAIEAGAPVWYGVFDDKLQVYYFIKRIELLDTKFDIEQYPTLDGSGWMLVLKEQHD